MAKIKAALCGYGGLGRLHANQLAKMEDVDLAAVCDKDPTRLTAKELATNLGAQQPAFDVRTARTYTDFAQLLEKEKPDVVFTALPTDLHAPMAIQAMAAGAHVFSEKPMALTAKASGEMVAASKKFNRKLMVGQCLRFWPEYEYLEKCIRENTHGRLLSLSMTRVGAYSAWSADHWMNDGKRSGGAILDLHLHDVDWAQAILGMPNTIAAGGKAGKTGDIDDVTAIYTYPAFTVTLRGSWMYQGFTMAFQACFERAAVNYGVHPDPALHLRRPGANGPEKVEVSAESAYYREGRYFIDCVKNDTLPVRCPPESTVRSVELVELERTAIAEGRVVVGQS